LPSFPDRWHRTQRWGLHRRATCSGRGWREGFAGLRPVERARATIWRGPL